MLLVAPIIISLACILNQFDVGLMADLAKGVSERHFQDHFANLEHDHGANLFGAPQNKIALVDSDGSNAVNFHHHNQLASEESQPPSQLNKDQAFNNNNNNHHDQHSQDETPPSADYYDLDQQVNSNNNINQNHNHHNQETFDAPMLSNFNNQNTHKRLPEKEYLSHHLAEKACRLDRGCQRKDRLNNTYLSYCTRYKLENLFSNEILMSIMHDSVEECDKILDEFIQLDELINRFDQFFKTLLTRYNCHNGYSVKWSCEDCKKAYGDWLCATNLPYYMNGERIKPCISFCERVEQRCPYLHPITKEQYGGQPVFICRDPNIPFVPKITPDIPYSEPTKCYDLCHLTNNETELLIDSLSKYDPDKCPSKGSIAEEVRSDPLYCRLGLEKQLVNISKVNDNNHDPYDANPLAEYPVGTQDLVPAVVAATTTNANGTLDREHNPISGTTKTHVHIKKLEELREVLTVNDRTIDHAKHWSTPRANHSPAEARRLVAG